MSIFNMRHRWRLIAAGCATAIVLALGLCEALGWPFLASPIERELGRVLDRRVAFSAEPAVKPQLTIHLLGGIHVSAAYIEIGAPAWSTAPHLLLARDARLTLGYADLWRARRGAPLRIRALHAAQLDAQLERLADGRASWQFGTARPAADAPAARLPEFGKLSVESGAVTLRDAPMAIDLAARFALVDGTRVLTTSDAPASLQLNAEGTYRSLPLRIELKTAGVLPVIADEGSGIALPVTLDARVGRASVSFDGTATDAVHFGALKGRFRVQGPSLAAVGDPLHVTLPTTGPFQADGLIVKQGAVWNAVLERVAIGSSRLAGAFTYDPQPKLPMLAGRLTGTRLTLADLGPTVGAPVRKGDAPKAAAPAASVPNAKPARLLPNREFDLPALRAMNANVLVDIDRLDLGSSILEPLVPLRTHLVLADGVLMLRDIDARTGQGHLGGVVQLDGRNAQALWTGDVRWDGVRLESWIHQARAADAPPYATGRLSGQARLAGQGKSTAAILGSLRGGVRMQLAAGTISHLAVEAAGLDIAQGLGMLIKGDDSLPIQCSVADLVAEQGLLRPRVLVLDTPDTTLWIDGSLSLATEALDLRVVATPKDFSPLALRTPVHLRGSFASPAVSLDASRLGARVGASALLALVNPLAALIPFIDVGNSADAKRGADACRALSQRIAAKPVLPAPLAAKPPKLVSNLAAR
jgi:AsmA family protein